MISNEDFAGNVVVITGASSGVGAATAQMFAKFKIRGLTICGREASNLEKTKEACKMNGLTDDMIISVIGDITKSVTREQIIYETINAFGQLDVLVNNAGYWNYGKIANGDLTLLDRFYQCNVKSIAHLCQLAIPHLERSKGAIINISSISAMQPSSDAGLYAISRAATDQLTKSLALEVGPKGIRVNSINPGVLNTPMVERTIAITQHRVEEIRQQVANSYPLLRIGETSDIFNLILFLASKKSTFITGTTIPCDGGAHLTNGTILAIRQES